jgi:hypothetical protein
VDGGVLEERPMKEHEERLYCIKYVDALERDRAQLKSINRLLNDAGVAIGDEHRTYSVPERVEHLATIKDYFVRQVDELRQGAKKINRRTGVDEDNLIRHLTGGASANTEQTAQVVKTAQNQ